MQNACGTQERAVVQTTKLLYWFVIVFVTVFLSFLRVRHADTIVHSGGVVVSFIPYRSTR